MLKTFSFLMAISVMTLSNGCKEADDPKIIETTPPSQARYFKEYAGPHENLKLIRDNLYQDENNDLYFKVVDASARSIFLKYEGVLDLEYRAPTQLTEIIDQQTWHQVFENFYADNDRLYCHHITSDGGSLARLSGIAPHGFKVILSNYENNTWRSVTPNEFDRSTMAKTERAWHITTGTDVIGYHCDNQGPLNEWTVVIGSK